MKSCTSPCPYGIEFLPVKGALAEDAADRGHLPLRVSVQPPLVVDALHLRRVDDARRRRPCRRRRPPRARRGSGPTSSRASRCGCASSPWRSGARSGWRAPPRGRVRTRRARCASPTRIGFGSTKPLSATMPVFQSCSKSVGVAIGDSARMDDGDDVLLPAPGVVGPVRRAGPDVFAVPDDVLVVHEVGHAEDPLRRHVEVVEQGRVARAGGGGSGIGLAWSTLNASRTVTPRRCALERALATSFAVGCSRSKS